MDAGHGGASGRFEALKELAKEFTFTGFRVNYQVILFFF
jgi:protease II